MERRAILAGAAALAGAAWLPIEAHQADRTRLILLDTGGGIRPPTTVVRIYQARKPDGGKGQSLVEIRPVRGGTTLAPTPSSKR
jgi:hypothetical protein